MLPMSREIDQLERLKKSLAVYRMVFGQPRQEDLAAWLEKRSSDEDFAQVPRPAADRPQPAAASRLTGPGR